MTQESNQYNEPSFRKGAWENYRSEMGDFPEDFYPAARRAFSIGHQRGYESGISSTQAYQEGYDAASASQEVPAGIPSPAEMRQAWWAAYTKSIRDRRGSHPTTAAEAKLAKEAGVEAVISLIKQANGLE